MPGLPWPSFTCTLTVQHTQGYALGRRQHARFARAAVPAPGAHRRCVRSAIWASCPAVASACSSVRARARAAVSASRRACAAAAAAAMSASRSAVSAASRCSDACSCCLRGPGPRVGALLAIVSAATCMRPACARRPAAPQARQQDAASKCCTVRHARSAWAAGAPAASSCRHNMVAGLRCAVGQGRQQRACRPPAHAPVMTLYLAALPRAHGLRGALGCRTQHRRAHQRRLLLPV